MTKKARNSKSIAVGPANAGRRKFIKQSVAAGVMLGGLSVAPFVRAQGSGQVVVRGLGGAYQEAMEKSVYQPFTAATGIKVVVQPMTAAQIVAMAEAGRVTVDVIDLGDIGHIGLDRKGILQPIKYDNMTFTDPDDIQPATRHPNLVGGNFFSTVMAYNTEVFKDGNHPKSWAEFWDVKKFPGARSMADQKSGAAELEFALLADGVSMSELYPLDLDRAFAAFDRIKPHVLKWWDTGALSAQLFERKEVVLGTIWNGRAQTLIDQGVPIAIEWNQARQLVQYWSIVKGAPNADNAQRFIDFAIQPKVQAAVAELVAYGPTNIKAFEYIPEKRLAILPATPEHFAQAFIGDANWWTDHMLEIGNRWQAWILQNS